MLTLLIARFSAFAKNYRYIEQQNAKKLSYTLGINKFADQSMAEFKKKRAQAVKVPARAAQKSSPGKLPKQGGSFRTQGTLGPITLNPILGLALLATLLVKKTRF